MSSEPFLFIILLSVILSDIFDKKPNIRKGRAHRAAFTELLFADDPLLISKNCKTMHHLLHLIESESEYYNFELNKSKCVVMDIDGISSIHFKNLEELKKEQNAKYLGGIINSEAQRREEINNRIKDTYTVFIFNKLDILEKSKRSHCLKNQSVQCSSDVKTSIWT